MLILYLLCLNILFTILVVLLFYGSIYRLFKLKAICHWNFWIYLFQLHINLLFLSLAVSTTLIFRHISCKNPTLIKITNISAMWLTFNNGVLMATLILICTERLIATIKNRTYELSKNPFILIIGLLASYCFGVVNVYIWNFAAINYLVANFSFYIIYSYLIMFIFFLYHKNKSLTKLSLYANIQLSQRYQIHENVRMIKYAIPFLFFPSIGLIIVGTIVFILENTNLGINSAESNTIYFTGSNLFILISFYRGNIKLIKANLRTLYERKSTVVPKKQKYEEKKKEGDIYFAQFKSVW